jgi:hypothetical protein
VFENLILDQLDVSQYGPALLDPDFEVGTGHRLAVLRAPAVSRPREHHLHSVLLVYSCTHLLVAITRSCTVAGRSWTTSLTDHL